MVDDVHSAIGGCSRGAIDAAGWEVGVGDVEGGFEEVGEFGEDVGVGFGVCAGVCGW